MFTINVCYLELFPTVRRQATRLRFHFHRCFQWLKRKTYRVSKIFKGITLSRELSSVGACLSVQSVGKENRIKIMESSVDERTPLVPIVDPGYWLRLSEVCARNNLNNCRSIVRRKRVIFSCPRASKCLHSSPSRSTCKFPQEIKFWFLRKFLLSAILERHEWI